MILQKKPATNSFSEGSFLNALYFEPLDPSLEPPIPYVTPYASPEKILELPAPSIAVPTNPYPLPRTNLDLPAPSIAVPTNPYPLLGMNLDLPAPSIPTESSYPYPSAGKLPVPSIAVPINISPVVPATSQQIPEPPKASEEESPPSDSRGQKRKGDEAVGKLPKKRCQKGVENAVTESVTRGEGTGISGEMKERAGKPTLSGRVPLMPTHLAEGGYQVEKKGVRGRKVPPAKKPRSKGHTAKPASKGVVKIPGKKKGNLKQ